MPRAPRFALVGYIGLLSMADRDGNIEVSLFAVDEPTLRRLVEVAVADAAPDDVTPSILHDNGAIAGWTDARVRWLRAFHRERRVGLEGPLAEATSAIGAAGEIVGAVRLKRTNEPLTLEVGIWLARTARQRGIASAAISEIEKQARHAGGEILRAETRSGNSSALRLLHAHGFVLSPQHDGKHQATLHLGAARRPPR